MNTIIFHKSFVPITGCKTTKVDIHTLTDLHCYLTNLFPELISETKTRVTVKFCILVDKKPLPISWIKQNRIMSNNSDLYVIPSVIGGTDYVATAIKDFNFTDFILKTATGLVISYALSFVIQMLMPKPKKSTEDSQDRRDNDMFGSIVNTIDSGIPIALNYGMPRIGGQIISSDIETLTDQRVPDPTPEVESSSITDSTSTGGFGYGEGYGSFGNDRDFAGTAGTLGDSPSPGSGSTGGMGGDFDIA